MPKTDIDYSNTIFYKISCIDPFITDVYVGHTTNFVQRKHAHKQSCINAKTMNYKCKLYEVIRNNGGWNNWKMEIINFHNCCNHYEARQKEQEYFISLKATLNSIEPMPKPKPKPEPKEISIKVKKEPCIEMLQNNSPNSLKKFVCECCDYKCSKKSDFDKHLSSNKHKSNETGNIKVAIVDMVCDNCNKLYKSRVGLWRHKKLCIEPICNTSEPIPEDKPDTVKILINDNNEFINVISDFFKSNSEFQKQMLEICKNGRK